MEDKKGDFHESIYNGSNSRFRRAIARRYINEGHEVIASGRRTDRLEKLKAEIGCLTETLDVTDKEAVFEVFSRHTDIDVLVNNAGLALGLEPAQETDIEDWERMVDTNIKGVMYCTRRLCRTW